MCSRAAGFRKERVDVADELGVVLEQESVRRVGVDLHPRLRDQAGEQVGEVRRDHRVAVAVGQKHGHVDRADPLQPAVVRDAPVAHGVVLRLSGLPVRLRVSIVAPGGQPPQGLHARLPARARAREEDAEVPVGVERRLAHRSDHLGCPPVHPGRAARRRGGEDQATDRSRPDQRDLLGDGAADREAEHVDGAELEGLEERDGVARHLRDRARRRAGRSGHAGVVEGHDSPVVRQRVHQRGVPVVEAAAEVLEEHERRCPFADLAKGVVDAVRGADHGVGSRQVLAGGSCCCGHAVSVADGAGVSRPCSPGPRPWPYRGADQGAPGRDAGARERTSCQGQSREEIAMSTAEALTSLVSDGRTELREGYADVGDVQLHYIDAGDGPLVVLLHGFPEFWYGWRRQIAPLAAAGFRVVAPDLRGYNLSSKPDDVADYSAGKLAGDVRGLIQERGAESAHVVGHDWGGTAAWTLAMNHPEVVDRLAVLDAAHPRKLNEGLRHPSQLRRSWYFFYFQLPDLPEHHAQADDWEFLQDFLRDAQPPYTPEEMERYIEAWSQPGAATAMINYYRFAVRHSAGEIRPITAPTLVIWGEKDRYLGPSLAEPHDDDVPNLDRVERLPDASHWVHHDEAERVNELLIDFFGPARAASTT